MLKSLYTKAKAIGIVNVCMTLPKNLRQYYANHLMLIRVMEEYGITE